MGARSCSERTPSPRIENGIPSRFEVNVLDVESGKVTTVLAREDGLTAESARWSPDGSRIVFVRSRLERDGEWGSALFIAEVATGSERRLTDWNLSAVYPDWGTDGRIVFSTYDLALFPQVERAGNLYTIAPDGSDLRAVTTFANAATVATQPRWTADGRVGHLHPGHEDGLRRSGDPDHDLDRSRWIGSSPGDPRLAGWHTPGRCNRPPDQERHRQRPPAREDGPSWRPSCPTTDAISL